MRGIAILLLSGAVSLPSAPLAARDVVEASVAQRVAVTVYRDPNRGEGDPMQTQFPQGFAMISETREVQLPPGESTIRFTGVAEGMVAVTAIVTGLPGGTIEKNRNADLLSPAALVDGTLGNRVKITRLNPGSGEAKTEEAVVRTRADGGLVLQTSGGFEAVRCSGLPEKLTFSSIPGGLSAQPVFSLDTNSPQGGTYTVTLTYLASGFDWQAHYVGTFLEEQARGKVKFGLLSWLTLLNDNGQSFADAELMAVAGRLSVVSDFDAMSEPPQGKPLRLACFPFGSTAAGSPVPYYPPTELYGYDIEMMKAMEDGAIVVTGSRVAALAPAPPPPPPAVMEAREEQLGDLKLYRVPAPVTVNAKGLKQVAFLNKDSVEGTLLYAAYCLAEHSDMLSLAQPDWLLSPTGMILETKNDEKHGLGVALPTGGISVFEPSARGDLLLAEDWLRDYAKGQDVEIDLGKSELVRAACGREISGSAAKPGVWRTLGARLANARSNPVMVRVYLGAEATEQIRGTRSVPKVKDGSYYIDVEVLPGSTQEIRWQRRARG
ncbi:hypothetical protein WAB17_10470 [Parerythrobacter aurantius]|uniref:DUF4139 domain-containing protein n=1 Tax=Parerythrobacter aurantius TaxID=3127706 RepID=UPI003251079A